MNLIVLLFSHHRAATCSSLQAISAFLTVPTCTMRVNLLHLRKRHRQKTLCLLFTVSIAVVVGLAIFFDLDCQDNKPLHHVKLKNLPAVRERADTIAPKWTSLASDVSIYSAFYLTDSVRAVAILLERSNRDYFCEFKLKNDKKAFLSKLATIDRLAENWNYKYSSAQFICNLTKFELMEVKSGNTMLRLRPIEGEVSCCLIAIPK